MIAGSAAHKASIAKKKSQGGGHRGTDRTVTLANGTVLTGQAAANYGRSGSGEDYDYNDPAISQYTSQITDLQKQISDAEAAQKKADRRAEAEEVGASGVGGVDVSQPNPATVNAQPFTGSGAVSPETLANPYYQQGLKQRHAALLASGQTPPASGGVSAVNAGIPEVADGSAALYAGDAQSYEGLMGQLIGSYREYMSDANQRSSLVDTYHEMMEDSGIEDIDAELLDMKNVIEGSEDDIRNEVTKAGGFATESQVQALTNARNKQLIKNYNTLLETRNTKEQYLNTMIGLEAQDRQAADARFNSAFNMGMQIVQYGQQMQQNAVSQMQWLATQPGGFESIQTAASTSPYYSGLVDKLFGGAGGLDRLSAYAAEDRAYQQQKQALEVQGLKSGLYTDSLQQQKLLGDLSETETAGNEQRLVGLADKISMLQTLPDHEGFKVSVGPTKGTRFGLGTFTGAKASFIANVEQIISQEFLDKLISVKGQGATFGQLSDKEGQALRSAATKIGTWRVVKNDNVVGYAVRESDFKKELETLRKYTQLAYDQELGLTQEDVNAMNKLLGL